MSWAEPSEAVKNRHTAPPRELPGNVELLPGFCGEIDAAAAHSEEIRLLPYRKAHVLLGWCNRCSGVRFVPVYAVG